MRDIDYHKRVIIIFITMKNSSFDTYTLRISPDDDAIERVFLKSLLSNVYIQKYADFHITHIFTD